MAQDYISKNIANFNINFFWQKYDKKKLNAFDLCYTQALREWASISQLQVLIIIKKLDRKFSTKWVYQKV